ncbi:hypothetical protein PTKIN_Ptkin15bG0108900 [Pterospermum kingtungense]
MDEANDSCDLPPNLRSITITNQTTLFTLPPWLQKTANTLRCLIIEDRPSFTNLPDWLQSFKSLRRLHITGCPQFPRFPEEMKFKIAHVPDVYVEA